MRFFKSFQILHRRTKSATFEAGPDGPHLNLVPQPKRSSLPTKRESSGGASSIFKFVTSKSSPVPSNFSHLRSEAAASQFPPSTSNRQSLNSIYGQVLEENARLREALEMWYREYSRVDGLLHQTRDELAHEQNVNQLLAQRSANDRAVIQDLRGDLSRTEEQLRKANEPKPPVACSHCARDLIDSEESCSTLISEHGSHSTSRLARSLKNRTIDDYQSALRMTLSIRRQLRDQRKLAKFWKNKALAPGQHQDVVTPSVSTVSSINEPLPAQRKAAVDVLMRERGLVLPSSTTTSVATSEGPSSDVHPQDRAKPSVPTSIDQPSLVDTSPTDELHNTYSLTLASSTSNPSGISGSSNRLAPLASDSLKAEINTFFGIQESSSRFFSSSKNKGLSSSASRMSSILTSSSSKALSLFKPSLSSPPRLDLGDLQLPVEPSPELRWIFEIPDRNAEQDQRLSQSPDTPWHDLSGATLADASFRSESSIVFSHTPSRANPVTCNTSGSSSSWLWSKHIAKSQHYERSSPDPSPIKSTNMNEGRISVEGIKKSLSRFKKPAGPPASTHEESKTL